MFGPEQHARMREARLDELDRTETHHACPLTKARPCEIHDWIAWRRRELAEVGKET